jgi:hypothetical protein
MYFCTETPRYLMCVESCVPRREPTEEEIEAAAKAWMSWQFPGRAWEDAVENMKQKFLDGAHRALRAAAAVSRKTVH